MNVARTNRHWDLERVDTAFRTNSALQRRKAAGRAVIGPTRQSRSVGSGISQVQASVQPPVTVPEMLGERSVSAAVPRNPAKIDELEGDLGDERRCLKDMRRPDRSGS